MEIAFQGKRALVTGAGKGIGRTTAVRLAELGAHVIAISRTQADLDSIKAEVPSIETCLLDIADWDKTRNAVERMGPIDLLVNNAGVVARGMVARGSGGAIVNVSSTMAAKRVTTKRTVYCCTKAALDMLSATMAVDLGPHKIRVNSVNPGLVLTPMGMQTYNDQERKDIFVTRTPLGRVNEENDIADVILYLLSDKAAMITGQTLPVDGGLVNVA